MIGNGGREREASNGQQEFSKVSQIFKVRVAKVALDYMI